MNDIQSDRYLSSCAEVAPPMGDCHQNQIALMDQLRQCERQIAVSNITAMIAHLVGTPLNVIIGRAGLIRRHPDANDAIVNDAVCIQQKVEQVTEKLRALIELLTPHLPNAECNAGDLVTETVDLYRPVAHAHGVELDVSQADCESHRINRFPVFVIVTSLISLAITEATPGSTVGFHANCVTDDSPGTSSLHVTITVPGRSFDDPRKFSRFEATPDSPKTANSLQVLGLCGAVARNAGGQLEVQPKGTDAELCLRWPSSAAGPKPVHAIATSERSNRK